MRPCKGWGTIGVAHRMTCNTFEGTRYLGGGGLFLVGV